MQAIAPPHRSCLSHPSPAQPSPAQPSPAQPSPAQPSPAQPSPAQPTPAPLLPTPCRMSLVAEQSKTWVTPDALAQRIEQALDSPRPLGEVPTSWLEQDEEEEGLWQQ
jgi:hypothetical protein